jgi:putative membrane protein
MMYDNYGNNGMGSGFGWIFMFFTMALVVLAIVIVVRHLSNVNHSNGNEDKSLDILKHRYAKGDIDKKEFEEKRKDLKS